MLNQAQIHRFHQDGFLLGDQVLDHAQVEELRIELDRVMQDKEAETKLQPVHIANLGGNPEIPVWQIVNMWQASDTFRSLSCNSKIVEEVAQLSSARELRLWHDQVQYKPAVVGGITGWHQDSPLWPILSPKTAQISAWVALDDVDESNGCLHMVPESHKWGVCSDFVHQIKSFHSMPKLFQDKEIRVVPCPVKKGYVHYHHGLTWHGSYQNSSQRKRRAIANHYMTEETVYDQAGGHVMKPYVTVNHGEKLTGKVFPLVWDSDCPA